MRINPVLRDPHPRASRDPVKILVKRADAFQPVYADNTGMDSITSHQGGVGGEYASRFVQHVARNGKHVGEDRSRQVIHSFRILGPADGPVAMQNFLKDFGVNSRLHLICGDTRQESN